MPQKTYKNNKIKLYSKEINNKNQFLNNNKIMNHKKKYI